MTYGTFASLLRESECCVKLCESLMYDGDFVVRYFLVNVELLSNIGIGWVWFM